MALNCKNCKHYIVDYEWDDNAQEEYEVYSCEKKHDEVNSACICSHFKEYHPRKYVEKDTECDNCENREICEKISDFIDCTNIGDTRKHAIFDKTHCIKFDGTNADQILKRRIAGLSYGDIELSIEREKAKKMVEFAKQNNITLPDSAIDICKELGIEV